MNVLVLKTNLSSQAKVSKASPILNLHPLIQSWNIDLDDIDNVLRIESTSSLKDHDIIELIETYGFQCESLAY